MANNYIQSPLNYTGGKYRLLPQILPLFPKNIDTFVDLFCGGANVGVNVSADKVIFNDSERRVISLLRTMKTLGSDEVFRRVESVIREYGLSESMVNGYQFYGCDSSKGLASYNRDRFFSLREDYNRAYDGEDRDMLLFVMVVYAFNNQIRFNSKEQFNISVGKRDFNRSMWNKTLAFIDRLTSIKVEFTSVDFRSYLSEFSDRDFVYADPPYLLSCATYNERGGWTEKDESDLYDFLDTLNGRGVRFALSNVFSAKGRKNEQLMEWSKKYRVIRLDHSYNNASYHKKDRESSDEEVLIVNY